MTTNFYVCLRRSGTIKNPGVHDWHAGITDKDHFKKRNSKYTECIVWTQFQTREEALAFEATASMVIPYVFAEEIWSYWETPKEEQDPWNLLATGDDTPDSVDAFSLEAAYSELLAAWRDENLLPPSDAALRSTQILPYRQRLKNTAKTAEFWIEKIRDQRPSPFLGQGEKQPVTAMWS